MGWVLILLWGIPRFAIVLGAARTGNYQWVSLIFVSMWLTPWLFFTREGRRDMGWRRPRHWGWLLSALPLGALACGLMYGIAQGLYGDGIRNWFVYISRSYSNLPDPLTGSDKLIYFAIYAGISMVFSPIGEEFFYRGVVHLCFAEAYNERTAALVDSAAFSITHLAHFGVVYHLGQWKLLPIPALLWMGLLFALCLLFSWARRRTGSILGAVLAHAGFNVAMIYAIFYGIW